MFELSVNQIFVINMIKDFIEETYWGVNVIFCLSAHLK